MVQQLLPLSLPSAGKPFPYLSYPYGDAVYGQALPLQLLPYGAAIYGLRPAPKHHPSAMEYFLANVGIALRAFEVWLLVGLEAS